MQSHRWKLIALAALSFLLSLAPAALASNTPTRTAPEAPSAPAARPAADLDDSQNQAQRSHRLIVELASPALVEWAQSAEGQRAGQLYANGRLDVNAPAARAYVSRLEAEQQAFIAALTKAVPTAQASHYINEYGDRVAAAYQILLNGITIDAGKDAEMGALREAIQAIPGVKRIHADYAYSPDLYASLSLINAPAMWNNPAVGGMANAGRGIKFASLDGGVHKDAPMFSGVGYTYPPGYPKGDVRNTNGKIIVSRAYFREWDPPAPGDENTWPGEQGTSHGVHTASIAAGNQVVANYRGITETISGVAPRAYVMSYRMFYYSIEGNGNSYIAEMLSAFEDIVSDGAEVVNNSWGEGPYTSGGEYDVLDAALIRAVNAGIFLAFSAGNAGPGLGTGDHPSDDYISTAATTTSGTFAAGRLQVTAPTPVSPTLQAISYQAATFGQSLTPGQIIGPWPLASGAAAGSLLGCGDPDGTTPVYPAGSLTGKAVLIQRGTCEFGQKVLNAQLAGAAMVIVYNSAAGGEGLISMGPGVYGDRVTIPAIFIGRTNGLRLLSWLDQHGAAARVQINTQAFQVGNTPDRVIAFSSRGPGANLQLKPDIAAPGVNILAQGYADAEGEARHLGYGEVSGTSMASPHVAGAAVLMRQIHPTWSPAWIKSALMSTAKFMDIYTHDERPAQPLDMGAGRLDLTRAADPGVILDPPSLSFSRVVTGSTPASITVRVTSVATATETYALSTLYTGGGFTNTTSVAGMSVTPASLTLAPGETKTITVSWNPRTSRGYGDNQGYLILDGPRHDAHLPAWMRVAYAQNRADVLIIDNDGSTSLDLEDYTGYYTRTLQALGLTYEVWNADSFAGPAGLLTTFPTATYMDQFPTVIYQSGDNFQSNGTFSVPTPPTTEDLDRLVEYANGGGHLLAFGQDLAALSGSDDPSSDPFFYQSLLGAFWIQDSVNGEEVFTDTAQVIAGLPNTPFSRISVDVSAQGDGAGNQAYMDEIGFELGINFNCDGPQLPELCLASYTPLMKYTISDHIEEEGYVAMAHREQPTLERPGTTYAGSSIYFTFGLEGVNNNTGYDTREELLGAAIGWGQDNPTASITARPRPVGEVSYFTVTLTSQYTVGLTTRWDFGDGSDYTLATGSRVAGHVYERPGTYRVRAEVVNGLGATTIAETTVTVPASQSQRFVTYLPLISFNSQPSQPTHFHAMLSGAQEVPPANHPATGMFDATYNHTTRQLRYTLSVMGMTQVSIRAAHIHRGAPGQNGPVAYPLYDGNGTLYPGSPVSGVVTLSPEDHARLMRGELYVNVHTTDFPGGAVRGQIVP